jgi:hypothetical protein
MRREPEFFENRELSLLFMARRLREALRLEELLTRSGVEYCVETGDYVGGFLFKRELTGAFFYVEPSELVSLRRLLIENRFKPYDPQRDR